jgi:YggT family protein
MTLYSIVHPIIELLTWFIIIASLLTFLPPHSRNETVEKVIELLEKLLSPIRKVVPPVGGIDLSPLVAIIVLQLIDKFLRGF